MRVFTNDRYMHKCLTVEIVLCLFVCQLMCTSSDVMHGYISDPNAVISSWDIHLRVTCMHHARSCMPGQGSTWSQIPTAGPGQQSEKNDSMQMFPCLYAHVYVRASIRLLARHKAAFTHVRAEETRLCSPVAQRQQQGT